MIGTIIFAKTRKKSSVIYKFNWRKNCYFIRSSDGKIHLLLLQSEGCQVQIGDCSAYVIFNTS